MNELEAVRRLQAYHKGRPLPRGQTKRLHIADDRDILIVTFVRMGGESRPWGLAYGHPGSKPTVGTVPEARNRDLVAEMAADFAPVLLRHLRAPGHVAHDPAAEEDLLPLRQVWLPNPTHLDMLHHLAYAYAFTKQGEGKRDLLNAFGRACGWLFRESQRPGDQAVVVATAALRQAFTFPAEDTRQGHLGFLLAWLGARGNRQKRIDAALKAERQTIATSLDPELERSELAGHVESWNDATRAGDASRAKRAAKTIKQVLASELERRWQLTEKALEDLRADKRRPNTGVAQLVEGTADEQWYQFARLELIQASGDDGPAFFPSVETDRNAAAAASRYFVQNASADLVEGLLVHDDDELLAEAVAAGDAVKGEIVAVRDDAPPKTGKGKQATRPVWVIRDCADRQLRLRTGSTVCVVGVRKREGVIRGFSDTDDGELDIEIEITGWKTVRPALHAPHDLAPNDPGLVGWEVAVVQTTRDGLSRRKSANVWARGEGPGAWLTHGRPGGVAALVADTDQDDVAAVERAEATA